MLFLNSCNSSTSSSDDKVTYSGIVKLIDIDGTETTSDEVVVAVFEKDIDDIAWDYRLEEPVVVTSTNEIGEFSYKANDYGNYFVYFLEEGYSIKEIRQNELTDSIILYENFVISGVITNEIILDGTSDLVIIDDVIFLEGSSLIINKDSKIRISPEKRISLYSSIDFSAPVHISSNDKSYTVNSTNIEYFRSFEITPSCKVMSGKINDLTFSFANNGLIINEQSDITMINNKFCNSNEGLSIIYSNNISIENMLAKYIYSGSSAGIFFLFSNNITINNSIFINNNQGVLLQECNLINIYNNNFHNNYLGLYCNNSLGIIEHNDFLTNEHYDISIRNFDINGELRVEYNQFFSQTAINQVSNRGPLYKQAISNNNFRENSIFIRYRSSYDYNDIYAENNYFDGIDTELEIKIKLVDSATYPYQGYTVNILPFKINPINNAGVQLTP